MRLRKAQASGSSGDLPDTTTSPDAENETLTIFDLGSQDINRLIPSTVFRAAVVRPLRNKLQTGASCWRECRPLACNVDFRGRRQLKRHLRGDGIEIGALHQPLDVSALPISRIRYVDRLPTEALRLQYPELQNETFVPIDIIDDGQELRTVAAESLDFIIANHLIEHCDNPLGTIENWLMKLRQGGIIFLAVPDQRKGWDERRPVTSLQHIIADYRSTPTSRKARNFQHFKDWAELVGNIHDPAHVQWLIEIDYSIHFHVFTFDSFHALLAYAHERMSLPFRIVEAVQPSQASWESVFVLEKTPQLNPAITRVATFLRRCSGRSKFSVL